MSDPLGPVPVRGRTRDRLAAQYRAQCPPHPPKRYFFTDEVDAEGEVYIRCGKCCRVVARGVTLATLRTDEARLRRVLGGDETEWGFVL